MSKKSSKEAIYPLSDRVLIRPLSADEVSETSASGIILPDTIDKEKPAQGIVEAVGEGRIDGGMRIPVSVKKGDRVVFSKYGYDEVSIGGEDYYLLKEDQLLAVIK